MRSRLHEYEEAARKYDSALRETISYMKAIRTGDADYDVTKEWRLSELWSDASFAISRFNPDLGEACFIKGQGWLDPQYWNSRNHKNYPISIEDMQEALMSFGRDIHKVANQEMQHTPSWFPVAGLVFTVLTFFSLLYLLVGPDIAAQKKVMFDAWFAFCVAASAAFLGGDAVSSGMLKIPFMKDAPIKFSAVGGIAIFVIVFILMVAANR